MRTKRFLAAVLLAAYSRTLAADDETGSSLTPVEAEAVVAEHNRIREDAGGVVEIAWDNELAALAQAWADELAKSDELRHRPENMHGENLAWSSAGPFTAVDAVGLWESEKEHYHGEAIDMENFMLFGHYTQVIWDRSTLVGCGRAVSASGGVYVVCNYSAAGNVIGERPITSVGEVQEGDPESP